MALQLILALNTLVLVLMYVLDNVLMPVLVGLIIAYIVVRCKYFR